MINQEVSLQVNHELDATITDKINDRLEKNR